MTNLPDKDLPSLQRQLAEARENLRLITRRRMAVRIRKPRACACCGATRSTMMPGTFAAPVVSGSIPTGSTASVLGWCWLLVIN